MRTAIAAIEERGSRVGQERDLRIDFFRGLALMLIFIDHVPGNTFGHFTLRNFGLADAAEVFVLLAGFSAILAYGKSFSRDGFAAGSWKIANRIGKIYVWHMAVVVASAILLISAAEHFRDLNYIEQVALQPFAQNFLIATLKALALFNQPSMLNILPLYIVLLAIAPALIWLIQRSVPLALAASVFLWLAANYLGFNIPAEQRDSGWFFNPFAWQLLFCIGACTAVAIQNRNLAPSRPLVALAIAYCIFAMLVQAPWTRISGLENVRVIPWEWLGPVDKSNLSLWRLMNVVAAGYLVLTLVAKSGDWLKSEPAEFVARCGRHALEIFSFATILSFVSWIALRELGSGPSVQVAVNLFGISTLGLLGWYLSERKRSASLSARVPQAIAHPQQALPVPG